jgi:hypothetical protein
MCLIAPYNRLLLNQSMSLALANSKSAGLLCSPSLDRLGLVEAVDALIRRVVRDAEPPLTAQAKFAATCDGG